MVNTEDLDGEATALRAFGGETLLHTDRGPIAAREITEADRLRAKTGEYVEIAWVEQLDMDADAVRAYPDLSPVLICQGELGDGPARNTVMSRDQQIWCPSDTGGAFRPASEISSDPDIFKRRPVGLRYTALACKKPTVIEADGLWVSVLP